MHIEPNCKALLICSKIITDVRTGLITLVDINSLFFVHSFPASFDSLHVFTYLHGGYGPVDIHFEVTDLKDDSVIITTPRCRIFISDRNMAYQHATSFGTLQFEHSGGYGVSLFINDKMTEMQRFFLRTPEEMERLRKEQLGLESGDANEYPE
jgi:hypothetical protein